MAIESGMTPAVLENGEMDVPSTRQGLYLTNCSWWVASTPTQICLVARQLQDTVIYHTERRSAAAKEWLCSGYNIVYRITDSAWESVCGSHTKTWSVSLYPGGTNPSQKYH
jgi:hypothetical protein